MIPGGLAWVSLFCMVLGAYYAPRLALVGAAALGVYLAVRFGFAGVAMWQGLRRIQDWESRDWLAEYNRRAQMDSLSLNTVHHVVIIPNYREEIAILRRTLIRLATQVHAQTSITVVLAMEDQEPGSAQKGALLQAEFSSQFDHVFVVTHPAGETACKSSNLSWAARWAKHTLVDRLGYNINHLVVTTTDADTLWHPRYFESLSVLFATDPQRYATFWQAPIRYHGNVWTITPLMRMLHAYSSAWELAYLSASWWRALPMSSYSLSMRLLHTTGYWDSDVIADEWHAYINTYFRRGGDIRLQPVYLPFLANATTGRNLWQALKERYLQTFRHAWGAKEIGYTVTQITQHRHVPLQDALGLLLRVAHDNLLASVGWITMALGGQLPVLFHPALLAHPLTFLIQAAAAVMTALTVLLWVIDLRIRPPRSVPWTLRARLYELASLPLLAVMTLCCVALPVLHAQTLMLLGIPIKFRVSVKT
ncbi:MAG: hypothetical protein JXQ72_00535 [Anaerolineae bacterium]|nr:hypothetical protein [Anaerolineae bacterium]